MLQKLNERLQGIVAWVVIVLIAITFALFGIDYYMQARHATNVQVTVNGEPITKEELELSYRRNRQLRDSSTQPVNEVQLKKQVLDGLILNTVNTQAAHRYGFEVTSQQANAAIMSIPQFQEDGRFSPMRYQQALSGALFTPESFQKEVRQGMLLNQQRFAFIGTAFALPAEIKQFVKLYMQSRNYAYLHIPVISFIQDGKISVTEKEINQYYQQHQKEFMSPEQVSLEYVSLSMADIKAKIKPTENQIKQYYEENQNNYLKPAKWDVAHILFSIPSDATKEEKEKIEKKANEVYAQLQKNPALFEEKVKQWSDDKISAINGGHLPWIIAGQSKLDKTLIHLTKPGEISAPVKTQYGYEIFKVLAYKPARLKPLSEVKENIVEQLRADLAQNQYSKALEELSDLSYQTPDSLNPVAEALNLPIQHTNLFSRHGGDEPLTQNKQVIQEAFSHDVMALGNNSEPLQLDNDTVIVLRIKKHHPASEESLNQVRSEIAEKLKLKKAQAQAELLGKKLFNAFSDASQIEKMINEHHLQWHTVNEATRETDKTLQAINELAFSIPHEGSHDGIILTNGDYVLVHLTKIKNGKIKALDKEQLNSITQQLESSNGVMAYELYVNGLMKKAEIKKQIS